MSGLSRFERRLEGLVSGVFARAFKGAVEPVELVAALKREVDNTARILSRDRRLVPNSFMIELGTDDFQRLSEYGRTLQHELANELREHADIQRYTFSGPIDIVLTERENLPVGRFRVRSATVGSPVRQRPPANDGQTQMQSVPPPPPQAPPPRPAGPIQVVLEMNGRTRPVNPPGVVLGRGTDADIQVNDPGVSRRHAEIRLMPEGPEGVRVVVVDLGSTNGTLVNGRRTSESELTDGSTIKIGTTELTLRITSGPAPGPRPDSGVPPGVPPSWR
ncbi:MAG: FhaA domain-containing protein [Kribbellaceae bacterium]